LRFDIGQYHPATLIRARQRERPADPGSSARYDCNAVPHILHLIPALKSKSLIGGDLKMILPAGQLD
jgi:hypothetical protein